MKKIYILVLLLFFISGCKKKIKGINDPVWKMESVQIAGFFCDAMRRCSENIKLDEDKQKLVKTRMYDASCLEIHKKSNVFELKGYDPELIKKTVRECFQQAKNLDCNQIRINGIAKIESCAVMRKIQKGELVQ